MDKTINSIRFSIVWVLLFAPGIVLAENFGGPNATENIIEEDAKITGAVVKKRITQPWFDWKAKMQEEHGFSIGVDYTAVGLTSSEKGASGDDNAASGMVRLFGSWDLLGRGTKNTGAIVYKVEHRHSYTDVSV